MPKQNKSKARNSHPFRPAPCIAMANGEPPTPPSGSARPARQRAINAINAIDEASIRAGATRFPSQIALQMASRRPRET
jgi:hypothetical protein